MKKLEKLLNLIFIKCLRENLWAIFVLIYMLASEILGILVAIHVHNYLILSIFTYMWVLMIVEALVQKIFFKKTNCKLLETPKATSLLFGVLFVVAVVLSWQYFEAFIFAVILAFMHADYNKTKNKMKKGE